ncbi:unnamed protein product [Porites lobata]|uniref:EGF-like repeat and discoidin I-like domain-containing protein 3 n=1 Tax=Porites lobata TaxID=104759 RepID=A0ABN8RF36_9CNID|nr:unnamed protein product [Porites lobata]
MFTTQSILTWQDEDHLSFPVINKNHRRLKRSAFHSFYSVSLVSCSLRCQSHHRCFSSNYRDASDHGGICEMNEGGAEPPIEENEDLEYDKNSVYTHFRNKKYGCQLTGCLNGGSCIFSEVSKTFRCVCKGPWIGEYCKACLVPLGMQSGAILDSQIRASSEWDINLPAQQARLHFVKTDHGAWSARSNDIHQWLQVDLLNTTRVSGVATQGRNGCSCNQWVTKYKLKYSEGGQAFMFYRRSGDNSDKVGNN